MDANFWLQKWKDNETAFHQSDANPLLVKHFGKLAIAQGGRVFVPLCGKTLDIRWLLSQGYRLAGAELSQLAIDQLFANLGVKPTVTSAGKSLHYHAPNIDIFVGDIFELSREVLGPIDAVYDRAALVALPRVMRHRYTAHLTDLTDYAPQLLLCFEYDQQLMEGPPFSISDEEVHQHYRGEYSVSLQEKVPVPGGFKGQFPANENVWLLKSVGGKWMQR